MTNDSVLYIDVDDEILSICQKIKEIGMSSEFWVENRAASRIETSTYRGGYVPSTDQFELSFLDEEDDKHWLHLGFDEVEKIISGEKKHVEVHQDKNAERKPIQVTIRVDRELIGLCREIQSLGRSHEDWKQNQIIDGLESENFVVGFLKEEDFFLTWYDEDGVEYAFNVAFDDLPKIVSGEISELQARRWPPEAFGYTDRNR
jgi:hypothetical protein